MFTSIAQDDFAKLMKGLLVLILIVVFGVVAAETQLNKLTHQHEFAQSFYVMRDHTGRYSSYLFGNGISVRAVYPIAQIVNNKEFIVLIDGRQISLPTQVNVDSKEIQELLELWRGQFINEAIHTKEILQKYITEFCRDLAEYIKQFR